MPVPPDDSAPRLILIRHSIPEVAPGVPAAQWRLSAAGRARCEPLTTRLAPYRPAAIVSSREPKAEETGALVAARLGVPCATVDGLHEHERTRVPYFPDRAAFAAAVAAFFAHPDRLVLGDETADQAQARFAQAVGGVLAHYPQETIAVITHGTVLAGFVARATGGDPFSLWQGLGLPAFVVLTRPAYQPLAIVNDVTK